MKRVLTFLLIGLLASSASGLSVGDSVAVNFDNAGDVGDFMVVWDLAPSLAGLDVAQNGAIGTGTPASGGIEAVNVGTDNGNNDMAVLYTPGGVAENGRISMAAGETLTASLKWKVGDITSPATTRFGIASFQDLDTATTGWTNLNINGPQNFISNNAYADGIGTIINKSVAEFRNVLQGVSHTSTLATTTPYTLLDGSWYQFELDITKSATVGDFDVTSTVNLLNADGTALDVELSSVSATVTNAGLYAEDMIAGFTYVHNAGPTSVSNNLDDFSVSIVPEPASMVLLGIGSMVLLRRKRKK